MGKWLAVRKESFSELVEKNHVMHEVDLVAENKVVRNHSALRRILSLCVPAQWTVDLDDRDAEEYFPLRIRLIVQRNNEFLVYAPEPNTAYCALEFFREEPVVGDFFTELSNVLSDELEDLLESGELSIPLQVQVQMPPFADLIKLHGCVRREGFLHLLFGIELPEEAQCNTAENYLWLKHEDICKTIRRFDLEDRPVAKILPQLCKSGIQRHTKLMTAEGEASELSDEIRRLLGMDEND